ncbi:MAG: dockerin type I repeat-containing protein [Ruminococcus sp.]|uniref:dockerin type I repeat-containing protein n=1 Tax=Ruminococcus sp. TaxID=41978 RepID=UPI0025F5B549|nr:dockerin type I repeat-containing protein [Ruminococcus sp.]MCR5601236.1 dockerin type I repeat-containing protein [Ruminococcus sp.]
MKKTKLLSLLTGSALAVQSLACLTASAEYYNNAKLFISVFNEDDGGFYTEDTDFMIVGSQQCSAGQAGAVFLDGFNTSEANPIEMTDIYIDTRNTYAVLDCGRDLDGYHYILDESNSDKNFTFDDGPEKKIELLMKKHFFIINSDQLSYLTHSEEVVNETGAVMTAIYNVINGYDYMMLDSVQRVNAVDAVLDDLQLVGLVSEHHFDNDEKTMEFTYNCGITGTLRPCVFLGRGDTIDDIKPPKKAEHDINCDGNFAVSDIISLQNWLVRNERAAYINFKAADLCPDGKIDVFDLVAAKKEILSDHDDENDNISFDVVDQIKSTDFSNISLEDSTYIVRSMNELNTITSINDGKAADIAGIDDDFFNDKALVLAYKLSGSSGINNTLDRIYSEDGILKTEITSEIPEICTCDMAYTRISAAVDKSAVEGLVTDTNGISFYTADK